MRVFMINSDICQEKIAQYAILKEEPTEMCFCDCYSKYGIKIGCNDAGCSTLDNYYAREEVLAKIAAKLKADLSFLDSFEEKLELCKQFANFEEIKDSIESHVMIKGYEFFNGRNWETLITEDEAGIHCDLLAVDRELEEAILKDFNLLNNWYAADNREETEKYIFHSFNMKRKIYLAIVEKQPLYIERPKELHLENEEL